MAKFYFDKAQGLDLAGLPRGCPLCHASCTSTVCYDFTADLWYRCGYHIVLKRDRDCYGFWIIHKLLGECVNYDPDAEQYTALEGTDIHLPPEIPYGASIVFTKTEKGS